MATAFARYGKLQIGGNDFNQAGYFTDIMIQENTGFGPEFGMNPTGALSGYSKGGKIVNISATYKVPVNATNLILLSDLNWDTTTYDMLVVIANYSGQYTGLKNIILDVKPTTDLLSLDFSRASTIRVEFFGTERKSVKG